MITAVLNGKHTGQREEKPKNDYHPPHISRGYFGVAAIKYFCFFFYFSTFSQFSVMKVIFNSFIGIQLIYKNAHI